MSDDQQQDHLGDDQAMFSRSMFGKCDSEVKVRIPTETKHRLQSVSHTLGLTESEFVRQLIELRIFGNEHVQKVAQARILAVGGTLVTTATAEGTSGEQK